MRPQSPIPQDAHRSLRAFPPVAELATASLAVVVCGGIYLAANLPHHVTLLPAVVLEVVAGLATVTAWTLLARVGPFAWAIFWMVFGRGLLANAVAAGMIEYVFVLDHTRGRVLAVLSVMLLFFATDVPLILASTVARHQEPDRGAAP